MIIKDGIQVEIEKYSRGNPDLILLSSEPFPLKKEDGYEISNLRIKAQTVIVDGEMFSWYGSRLLKRLIILKCCIKLYLFFED
jgi:hypothetical protein